MDKHGFRDVMDIAISQEIQAHEFYQVVADILDDAFIEKLFREFADEEKAHADILFRIREEDIENFSFCGSEGFNISETCVGPAYGISENVPSPKLSVHSKPAEVIALAMKKKEEAVNIYSNIADQITDPDKKRIFGELAKMELAHKEKLENLYTNTAFPEKW